MEKAHASSPVLPAGAADPGGHAVQVAWAAYENVFFGHSSQLLSSDAPSADDAFPAGQSMQAV